VSGDSLLALKAFYSGKAIEVVTSDGSRLSMTAQHPVLTQRGWVSADDLNQTDNLVCYRNKVSRNVTSGHLDKDNLPPKISDVFDTLSSRIHCTVPRSSVNLYGDIEFIKGEIDIVGTDRRLLDEIIAKSSEFNQQRFLTNPNGGKIYKSGFSGLGARFGGRGDAWSVINFMQFISGISLPDFFAMIHDSAIFSKEFTDSLRAHPMLFSQAFDGFTREVVIQDAIRNASPKPRSLAATGFVSPNSSGHFNWPDQSSLSQMLDQSMLANSRSDRSLLDAHTGKIVGDSSFIEWLRVFRQRASLGNQSRLPSSFRHGSLDARVFEDYIGDPITNPQAFSSIFDRHAGLVALDKIVSIRSFDYSGHVYDLETKSGTILANGGVYGNHYVLSNCRCTTIQLTAKAAEARGGVTQNPPNPFDDGDFGINVCNEGSEEITRRSLRSKIDSCDLG
jgi:hypothetical protein